MDYDSKYSKKECYWERKPNHLLINSIRYMPSNAKILDLGCGEGKEALFLAKKGFDVTAVDHSKVGINKIKKYNPQIKTSSSDIGDYLDISEKYDVIIAMDILQFIDEKNIFKTIEQIQSKTKPNGLNVIASFVAENPKQKEMVLSKGKYFFDEGELKELYQDWKILFYEEKLGDWETHGEPRHRHFTVKMIAQKK